MGRDKAGFNILNRIEEERLKRGWTEYQLAVNSGLTQSTISTWKKRSLQPNIASIEKICSGLGISLSEFFHQDGVIERSLTEEQQCLLDLWNQLSPLQRDRVTSMLQAFISGN